MSEQPHRDEKDEKEREKDEKNWDEKWQRDPLSAVVWASILIWAGLVLLVDNMGWLNFFKLLEAWSLIFIGAGLIVLAGAGVRLLVPAYRRPASGDVILGIILCAVGIGGVIGWNIIWPLVLIAVGAFILLRGFLWPRR